MLSQDALKRMREEFRKGKPEKKSEKSDVKTLSTNSNSTSSSFGAGLAQLGSSSSFGRLAQLGSSQSLSSYGSARAQKRTKTTSEISNVITNFMQNLDSERVITNEERADEDKQIKKFENMLTC